MIFLKVFSLLTGTLEDLSFPAMIIAPVVGAIFCEIMKYSYKFYLQVKAYINKNK